MGFLSVVIKPRENCVPRIQLSFNKRNRVKNLREKQKENEQVSAPIWVGSTPRVTGS